MIFSDAQTSGGLLMGVQPDRVDNVLNSLKNSGYIHSAVIGEVREGDGRIEVK